EQAGTPTSPEPPLLTPETPASSDDEAPTSAATEDLGSAPEADQDGIASSASGGGSPQPRPEKEEEERGTSPVGLASLGLMGAGGGHGRHRRGSPGAGRPRGPADHRAPRRGRCRDGSLQRPGTRAGHEPLGRRSASGRRRRST